MIQGLTIGALLMMSAVVHAQTAKPDPLCVSAWNALSTAKQLQNVKLLTETNCQVIHTNGWLPGAGVVNKEICVKPWNALVAAKMEENGKQLVSKNCAIMTKNEWKLPPAEGAATTPTTASVPTTTAAVAVAVSPNPVCVAAWNALSTAKQLDNVKVLKETDCQIIHTNGWLPGTGVQNKDVCVTPWNALVAAKMAENGKKLVSNNCAVMAKNGWK